MKIYNLKYKDKVTSGAFFFDPDFGYFFFTKKIDFKLLRHEQAHFEINDQTIICDATLTPNTQVHRVNFVDGYVYVFAIIKKEELAFEYVTLEELNSNEFIFSTSDVLNYLADYSKLPNGNYIVGSVQSYITAIENLEKENLDKETFFRGHYSYKYDLTPSIFRKKKYLENEATMAMDFKTQFYNELSTKKYIEILTTMQHYKMPTRLLDTTSNPLVALFMACDKPNGYKSKGYNIGEVIVMNEDKKNVKYSDSNAVTMLSSLAVLETKYKQELYNKIMESLEKGDSSIYKNCIAYRRFKAELYNELPYFDEDLFSPEVLIKPVHVRVGMINERIIAQSGNFILFGLCDYQNMSYVKLPTVSKERIFIVNSEYIKSQLQMLNITSATMYPDKDHMSQIITKSYDK